MDTRVIVYRDGGMPFYTVTFPPREADGLLIQNLRVEQLAEYAKEKDIKRAYIYGFENFEKIKLFPQLEMIEIELQLSPVTYPKLEKRKNGLLKKYDAEPLYNLKSLRGLGIIENDEPWIKSKINVDLSQFPKLERFLGDFQHISNLDKAHKLKSLWVNFYSNEDLKYLSDLKELDSLELISSKLKTLDGCENLKKLQCLYLYYNRSLSDISALKEVKHSLRALRIEACGKIKDFSVLNELENLELLELSGSNELPDLSFIKNMKSLKTFVFSMPVLDGDITPCLNLQYAAIIRGKRYYNLRDSQLPKGESVKGNDNIEMWRRFE